MAEWSRLLDFLASSLSLRCFFFLISANRLVSCVVNSFLGLLGDLERDLDLDLWDLDETFLSLDTRSLSLVGVLDLSLMKGDLTKNVVRSKQTNFLSHLVGVRSLYGDLSRLLRSLFLSLDLRTRNVSVTPAVTHSLTVRLTVRLTCPGISFAWAPWPPSRSLSAS